MGLKIEGRPLHYNPWFKIMFTGEIFLLSSYTFDYCHFDIIGTTLVGINSDGKKREFNLQIPNNSKLKIELHMDEGEELVI